MITNPELLEAWGEHTHQVQLFTWADVMVEEYDISELALMFAIPNGGHRHKRVAQKLRAEGLKPGVPDVFLPVARGGYHGCWIEMKRLKRGRMQPSQRVWQRNLREQGYRAERCDGWIVAATCIADYLGIDKTKLPPWNIKGGHI